MGVTTAIQFRTRRARLLVADGAVQISSDLGHFMVKSQVGGRQYTVQAHVDPKTQWVMKTYCSCPDWLKMSKAMEWWINTTGQSPHPGISHIDYSPCCKHVLAALLRTGFIE